MPSFTSTPMVRTIHGLLARDGDNQDIKIHVAPSARDAVGGHTPTTILRQGLILCKLTSGANAGMYAQFNSGASDGSEDSSTAVILDFDLEVDTVEGNAAAAYMSGTFQRRLILVGSGFDYSLCQRLMFRDDNYDAF